MRKYHLTTAIVSGVLFLVFGLFAYEVNTHRSYLFREDRGRELLDELHGFIAMISFAYFAVVGIGSVIDLRKSHFAVREHWMQISVVAGCVMMVAWSCLLSSRVSFDEVFPAWLLASAAIGSHSALKLRTAQDPKNSRRTTRSLPCLPNTDA